MATAALQMPAGEGGSEVNALTNMLAFGGRRCIIHLASHVPAASQSALAHASLIGSAVPLLQLIRWGPCPQGTADRAHFHQTLLTVRVLPGPPVGHVHGSACVAQPGWGR